MMGAEKWRNYALYLAWLIALIGFCGSIFYGEILKNPPCPLCWYQRIALFPLVILLGIAAYKGETMIIPYVLPIVILGACIALFQIFRPMFPILQQVRVCGVGSSCEATELLFFNIPFIPFLSSLGFFAIATLLILAKRTSK